MPARGAQIVRRNFRQYDRDNGQPGMIAPSTLGWSAAGTATAASTGRIARVVPSRNMTVVNLGFWVSAWTAGDTANPNVDLCIYNAALTTKLATTGATASKLNSVGRKTVPLTSSLAVSAGIAYYVGMTVGTLGTSTVSLLTAAFGNVGALQLFGATAGLIEGDANAAAGTTMPSTWGAPSLSSSIAAMIVLLET